MTDDSLFLNAFNGATNVTGSHHVIWLMMFSSWCPYCQDEAPFTQEIYQAFQDSGLVVIGAGWDWGQPDSCDEWVESYSITYPMLDDEGVDNDEGDEFFFDNLGGGGVPWNVVIDHEMIIRYSEGGYNPNILNVITEALEDCGDLCTELFDPNCNYIVGEIDNTFTSDDQPIINVMDVIRLADVLSFGAEIDNCMMISGDISNDGVVNIVDVLAFAAMLSLGQFDN